MKWPATIYFSVSHYDIYPAHELPYQNSGVYINLGLESLTCPMRWTNLNCPWWVPLSSWVFWGTFCSPGPWHSYLGEPLGIIFNHFILLPKLNTRSRIDVPVPLLLSCPFWLHCRWQRHNLGPDYRELGWGGMLDCAVDGPQPELGCWLSQGNAGCAASIFGLATGSHALPFCWGLITCWIFICPKDYLVILRNPGSPANVFPSAGVPRGEHDRPFSFLKGPSRSPGWKR